MIPSKLMTLMVHAHDNGPREAGNPCTVAVLQGRGSHLRRRLNELMDDRPPMGFIREHLRRLKEEEFSDWKDVRKRLRL